MHDHYIDHPEHSPKRYGKVAKTGRPVGRHALHGRAAEIAAAASKPVNGKSEPLGAPLGAVGALTQLAMLKHNFEAEVDAEETAIEQLRQSLAAHEQELARLRSVMRVLGEAVSAADSTKQPVPAWPQEQARA
jgi:uncharacterized coiled-coil protein SlyX